MSTDDSTQQIQPPSTDKSAMGHSGDQAQQLTSEVFEDLQQLEPETVMRVLAKAVQGLADMTGDIPATPPVSRPTTPSLSRSTSYTKLAALSRTPSRPATPPARPTAPDFIASFNRVAIGSPESPTSDTESLSEAIVISSQPALPSMQTDAQYDAALSRKFFSKKAPPISIEEYFDRLQRYCPMSTGVCLAASAYIHRLVIVERRVPVTPRTAHRLVLASLRVAMKANEDLSYPHARFAGVGGVAPKELAKLELTLCYLLQFDLRIQPRDMKTAALGLLAVPGLVANRTRLPLRLTPTSDGIAGRRAMAMIAH